MLQILVFILSTIVSFLVIFIIGDYLLSIIFPNRQLLFPRLIQLLKEVFLLD